MSPDYWRALYLRERDARIDAEARLSGLRSAMGAVVIAVVVGAMLIECLSATNEASRAVARWEVAEPVTR